MIQVADNFNYSAHIPLQHLHTLLGDRHLLQL
jgi:hypothetical protein